MKVMMGILQFIIWSVKASESIFWGKLTWITKEKERSQYLSQNNLLLQKCDSIQIQPKQRNKNFEICKFVGVSINTYIFKEATKGFLLEYYFSSVSHLAALARDTVHVFSENQLCCSLLGGGGAASLWSIVRVVTHPTFWYDLCDFL